MALSDKDIARLYTSLELPIIAGEALAEQHMLDPDEEYAFHQAMSDMQPDAALLCMALCAEQLCLSLPGGIKEAQALLLESDRILVSYGGLWLVRITENRPVPEEFILDALKNLPRDHAKIRSLMLGLDEILPAESQAASQLLHIMQIQAEANILIAEAHLEALGINHKSVAGRNPPPAISANANDNGTVFPAPEFH